MKPAFETVVRSSPAVSARPQPDVWSPLEYGAHVRDVYRLFDARLAQLLSEDTPTFASWDQDETAIAERYREQDDDQDVHEDDDAEIDFGSGDPPLRPEPDPDELSAEQLKAHLERLRPEDFGKFNP